MNRTGRERERVCVPACMCLSDVKGTQMSNLAIKRECGERTSCNSIDSLSPTQQHPCSAVMATEHQQAVFFLSLALSLPQVTCIPFRLINTIDTQYICTNKPIPSISIQSTVYFLLQLVYSWFPWQHCIDGLMQGHQKIRKTKSEGSIYNFFWFLDTILLTNSLSIRYCIYGYIIFPLRYMNSKLVDFLRGRA